MVRVSNPGKGRRFLCSENVQTGCGPYLARRQMCTEVRVKRPGRDADRWPPSGASAALCHCLTWARVALCVVN